MQSAKSSHSPQPSANLYRQIREHLDKTIIDRRHHFELEHKFSARSGLNRGQLITICAFLTVFSMMIWCFPNPLGISLHWIAWLIFCLSGILRLLASITHTSVPLTTYELDLENLPTYSVLVALYKESPIIQQLIFNLKNLNYPTDKLEILILLEQDDDETRNAISTIALPSHFHVLIVPEGVPKTKPRALNYGLSRANGTYIVVYDAEDRPDKDQLLIATNTFLNSDDSLICLQAPLRPVGAKSFVGKQFTLEYGLQFENFLPFLNNLGLPFPLGGTSNHFNAQKLREVGGWDAYNVTEDADLGIRLSRFGYNSGLIDAPTYESAPETIRQWLPQRTRWIKGYLQTLIVHLRTPFQVPPKALISMQLSLGLGTASTLLYAPLSFLYLNALGIWFIMRMTSNTAQPATFPYADTALFLIGNLSLMAALKISSQRRSRHMSIFEAMGLPIYWCLQSLAGIFAIHQLLTKPFHWDKTDHTPTLHVEGNDQTDKQ